MQGRVLIVAGSDSGGGAGIQADIKTITALGSYAASAVTALTAQNTLGVFGVVPVDPEFVAQQMEVVLADIGADVIKIGMLHSAAVIRAVAAVCRSRGSGIPIVLDPVMTAKGNVRLLQQDAEAALATELLPMAALLTPNIPEAQALTGMTISGPDDLGAAADHLLALGPSAVLVKGGHLAGDNIVDLLRTADGMELRLEGARLRSRNTHGTGCTLAAAIAAGLAEGLRLSDAVERARAYVLEAIRSAPGLGQGHGPLNHAHPIERLEPERERHTLH